MCGTVREAAARDTHGRPLCPNCMITDPANQEPCVGCGRRCSICGRSAPCLAGADYPDTVLAWLGKDGENTGAAILRALGTGDRPLTRAALDELPDSKPLEHLRAMLVAAGALPAREEQLAGWNAGSPAPSAAATTPPSSSCCTATPSGTCCAGSATATAAPTPPTASADVSRRTAQQENPVTTQPGVATASPSTARGRP